MFKTVSMIFIAALLSNQVFAKDAPKFIPGLLPSNVYNAMTVAGFVKTGPEIVLDGDDEHYRWELSLGDYFKHDLSFYMKIWSFKDVDNVYRISVHSKAGREKSSEDEKIIATVMRLASTFSYPGAKPDQISDWIVGNINKENISKVVGGVEFAIDSLDNDSNLVITVFDPQTENTNTTEGSGYISPND